ncbi:MAG: phosphatidate cytidylyltransferase [Bacteroidota bacterium]
MNDPVPVISYAAELRRKALHLLALAIPAGILFFGREVSLWVLVPLAVIALAADWSRHRITWARTWLHKVFAPLMRPEEIPPFGGRIVFNGATMMCTAAALCVLLFSAPVAALALAIQQTGDAAAALVGRPFGKTRWPGSPKSVEGTVAFALVAALTGWAFAAAFDAEVSLAQIAVGAVVAALVEVLPIPVNDNLRVPLAAALAMLLVGLV